MIYNASPLYQSLLGTFFTWGVTALGSALVFVISTQNRKLLDGSLGFSAGVMLAASYWSLLDPAIEAAEQLGLYGKFAFLPVACGFFFGAGFIQWSDSLMTSFKAGSVMDVLQSNPADQEAISGSVISSKSRRSPSPSKYSKSYKRQFSKSKERWYHWLIPAVDLNNPQMRRLCLLLIAITVHNAPEGMAVGAGFANAHSAGDKSSFLRARHLAIGIGIQNFPEGLAVSLPLAAAGYSKTSAFWYGQLSGMVEPIAGVIGCVALSTATGLLPWALSFAAGAMVFVVLAEIIPEIFQHNNGRLGSWFAILGFIVMMSLDVGLG